MYKPRAQGLVDWILNGTDECLAWDEWVNTVIDIYTEKSIPILNIRDSSDDYYYQLESWICQIAESHEQI